ncbi:hypothetical protein CDV25_05505 [Helicobacter apodemus]|uniref:Uncharacterized protein n=1 Tax=Helicobacter apodemus TaxID=135569 RepID=A0A2U8FC50_9HELI|nr:hypothetical protein CDV25_02940 [Helicobacter apodemus]AWI34278.1 hypothetical protein CDV25_05505 [Helicobacter apodemus]
MNPKPLDSQSLISQLFNPKFLDSIIESKFHSNLKALIFNQLIPKLLTLQEYFKFTFFNINKFIINICYNIFNFIKVNIFYSQKINIKGTTNEK